MKIFSKWRNIFYEKKINFQNCIADVVFFFSDWLLSRIDEKDSFTKDELKYKLNLTPVLPYEMVICAIGDMFDFFRDQSTTKGVCQVITQLASKFDKIVFNYFLASGRFRRPFELSFPGIKLSLNAQTTKRK